MKKKSNPSTVVPLTALTFVQAGKQTAWYWKVVAVTKPGVSIWAVQASGYHSSDRSDESNISAICQPAKPANMTNLCSGLM